MCDAVRQAGGMNHLSSAPGSGADPRAYPRRMGEPAGVPLTPEQQERMRRAVLAELRRISAEAVAAGMPPATIAIANNRKRVIGRATGMIA